jgi:hypothetical protein
MGHSAKKIDPLFHRPHNVWDSEGQLIGTYFPASQVIRLTEGDLLQVDSSGKVRYPRGEVDILDRHTFVLKPMSREK